MQILIKISKLFSGSRGSGNINFYCCRVYDILFCQSVGTDVFIRHLSFRRSTR